MSGGSALSIIRQLDIIDRTTAVCRPSVFFFLLLLFVQYLPPFLQRDADPFGLRRACNSTLVTSLAPSVFLHSRRGGLVYTVLVLGGGRAGRDVRCRAGATAAPVLIRSVSPAAEDF